MFKGKMDDNFSEFLKDGTSQVKKQTQCKKKFTNRQHHSETEKHRRKRKYLKPARKEELATKEVITDFSTTMGL